MENRLIVVKANKTIIYIHQQGGQSLFLRGILPLLLWAGTTVVVDKDADLDLAAESIVVSAFGFSGQKCSAGSRAVIHQDVYNEVLEQRN